MLVFLITGDNSELLKLHWIEHKDTVSREWLGTTCKEKDLYWMPICTNVWPGKKDLQFRAHKCGFNKDSIVKRINPIPGKAASELEIIVSMVGSDANVIMYKVESDKFAISIDGHAPGANVKVREEEEEEYQKWEFAICLCL